MLRYMTDRARPGLVTFYDIRPGIGAGLFYNPGTHTGLLVLVVILTKLAA